VSCETRQDETRQDETRRDDETVSHGAWSPDSSAVDSRQEARQEAVDSRQEAVDSTSFVITRLCLSLLFARRCETAPVSAAVDSRQEAVDSTLFVICCHSTLFVVVFYKGSEPWSAMVDSTLFVVVARQKISPGAWHSVI